MATDPVVPGFIVESCPTSVSFETCQINSLETHTSPFEKGSKVSSTFSFLAVDAWTTGNGDLGSYLCATRCNRTIYRSTSIFLQEFAPLFKSPLIGTGHARRNGTPLDSIDLWIQSTGATTVRPARSAPLLREISLSFSG